jgi:hypothetical protein
MLKVKLSALTPRRLSDLARWVFYETLPISCLALLWTFAWARSFEQRVHAMIENTELYPPSTILAWPQPNNRAPVIPAGHGVQISSIQD